MPKLTETVLAGSIGIAAALSCVSHAQTAPPLVKNILLVHGAFADGTSWAKVIPILEARGFHVVAVQNPLTSLAEDHAALNTAVPDDFWKELRKRKLVSPLAPLPIDLN
jgi:hypothetical protein